MRIGGAGFLRNQYFDFHEGLNCLIGGKGVGKSLAIEILRFVLDQAPTSDDNLLDDHIKKLEKRLEEGNPVVDILTPVIIYTYQDHFASIWQ
jgi:predicted ATP-dependent endonuclease of OLD family